VQVLGVDGKLKYIPVLNQTPLHKDVWGIRGEDPYILNFDTNGGESVSRPGCLTPGGIAPDTHWIGGCVDPPAGLDGV